MTRGLASEKFSASIVDIGKFVMIAIMTIIVIITGVESFLEKNGWNCDFSMFGLVPVGVDDPVLWSIIRWMMNISEITIGIMKCKAKNRVSVGCPTENPPHIHSTNFFPKIGMAEKMFVITVAPQNDICPQGRTYPRNAVAITITRIIIPVVHTLFFVVGELNSSPRAICM